MLNLEWERVKAKEITVDEYLIAKTRDERSRRADERRDAKQANIDLYVPLACKLALELGLLRKTAAKITAMPPNPENPKFEELFKVIKKLKSLSLLEAYNRARRVYALDDDRRLQEYVKIEQEVEYRREYQKKYQKSITQRDAERIRQLQRRQGRANNFVDDEKDRRDCLKCDNVFLSESKSNRICPNCKSHDEYSVHGEDFYIGN